MWCRAEEKYSETDNFAGRQGQSGKFRIFTANFLFQTKQFGLLIVIGMQIHLRLLSVHRLLTQDCDCLSFVTDQKIIAPTPTSLYTFQTTAQRNNEIY